MNLIRALSEYLRPVLYAARRGIIEVGAVVVWALVIIGSLWTAGAAVGLFWLGVTMMAGAGC